MTASDFNSATPLETETNVEQQKPEQDQNTSSIYANHTTNNQETESQLNETSQQAPVGLIGQWRIKLQLAFAFITFILIGANDAVVGVLIPRWGDYYHVDKGILSFAFLAGSLGYLIAAINCNFLSRKLGNVNFMLLGNISFLTGTLLFCSRPPLYVLIGVPLLLGFGVAILEAALNTHLTNFSNKTALLNYLHAFYGVGALVTPFIASQLLEADISWNIIYFLIAAISLSLLLSLRGLFTQADANPATTANSHEDISEDVPVESPLKFRFVWIFAFFLLFYGGAEICLGNWSYSFLTEYRDESTTLAGWLVSGYWLGLTVGRIGIAPLANRLGSKGIINISVAGTICGLLIFNLFSFTVTNGLALLLIGFCLGPILPTAFSFLSNVMPEHLLMGSISFIASLSSLGKALFPWLAGNVAAGFGLSMFLPYVIILAVCMVSCWLIVLARSNHQTSFQAATET